jgi:ferritin-like metal-binding protein YciE
MQAVRETLITWLRDAHAMEAAKVNNLDNQIDKFEHMPQLRDRFRLNQQAARQHSDELERCLKTLGSDPSTLKDAVMKFAGVVQPYVSAGASDDPLKNLLAADAYEHFEIASFRSLSTAARQVGESEIAAACDRFEQDEVQMANWIEAQIPQVTRQQMGA